MEKREEERRSHLHIITSEGNKIFMFDKVIEKLYTAQEHAIYTTSWCL